MTDESSNRDQWLAQIKQSVQTKVGDQWKDARWSEYVKGVVWWLHTEIESDSVSDAAAGLMKYGIAKEGDLKHVAGIPPNKKDFREALMTTGVPPIVCDLLFNKYIPQQQQQQQQQPAFVVGAIVRGAKQSNGARGNVFKFLERHNGHYWEQEGIQIHYNHQDDLTVKAYFLSYYSACQMQNALNEWEIHKDLANLNGVTLDPLTPSKIDLPANAALKRIYLQDYHPTDSESPCQTLNQLHSYRLSVPITEPAEMNTPLVQFQSIDKPVPHINHYKCHLKDKAKFRKLQNNENNMVAASWTFHQQLDGLNVQEGIPLVAMSVKDASKDRSASHDNRYRVTLTIAFFYSELATSFAAREGAQRRDRDKIKSWETVVYVQDKNLFSECVEWKFQDTMKQWREHRAFLEQE